MKPFNELISCAVMILAAGEGKRMRSPLPKVLHEMGGKPLLYHVLFQVQSVLPHSSLAIVVGHGREQVEEYVLREPLFKTLKVNFILQSEQRGTGHAARCAMDSEWGKQQVQMKNPVLVLPGDLPLISSLLIQEMTFPLKRGEALRLLTCELSEPAGYGRVMKRGKNGKQNYHIMGIPKEEVIHLFQLYKNLKEADENDNRAAAIRKKSEKDIIAIVEGELVKMRAAKELILASKPKKGEG